jgi:hypothetical protein
MNAKASGGISRLLVAETSKQAEKSGNSNNNKKRRGTCCGPQK